MKKKEESFFKLISQKPWEASQAVLDDQHDGKTLALSKAKLGVRTIMVVSTIIFSLLVISYSDRMLIHDWRNLSEPWLLWINTIILILTSIVFHRTKVLVENNEFDKTKNSLLVVGFLTFAFITGQLLVWQHFVNLGQYASTNPANAFFYVLTALHGHSYIRWFILLGKSNDKLI